LCDVGNGSKNNAVLVPVMPSFILQSIELLE